MAPIELDKNGIPTKSPYPNGISVGVLYSCFNGVFLAVGGAISYAVYTMGATAQYDAKMSTIKALDLGWIYAGLFAVKLGSLGHAILLGSARKESKVAVPDQHVYKQHGETKYTLMETEGVHGRFNRAQRAWCNYLEGQPYFLALFLVNAFVFPFPSFCMACLWLMARVMGARGYVSCADERMGPNMLGMLTIAAFESMLLLVSAKTITV